MKLNVNQIIKENAKIIIVFKSVKCTTLYTQRFYNTQSHPKIDFISEQI